MTKVLWLTNYPSPYRVDFFSELGKYVDLTVLFENSVAQQTHRNQQWFNENYRNFTPIFLKQTVICGKKIALDVINYVTNAGYTYIILGDYSTSASVIAALLMRMKGIKYSISIDGAYMRKGSRMKRIIKKACIKGSSFFFSTSNTSDQYLISLGAEKGKIHRYNFTTLHESDILKQRVSYERKMKLREKLGMQDNIAALIVGRFVYIKGIDFVLNMADKVTGNIDYYIAGDVPTDEYRKIVEEHKLFNVHFIGFQPKENLKEYYDACDIFVFPTRYDPWGLVINEAMSRGLPIISTDQSAAALHFIKDGKNGYIYHVDDESEYLGKMEALISNYETLEAMGALNLKIIKDYTIEKMTEQHVAILTECEQAGG